MYWKATADRLASIGPWMCIHLESTVHNRLRVPSLAPLPWPAATALAVGSSIVLRTLEELLQAKSKRDLVAPLSNRALEVLTIVRAFAKSIGREEQERFRAIYSARLESLTSREFRAVVRKFQEAVDHERTFGAAASAHRGTKFWSALESLDEIIEQIKAAEARTATGRRRRP